MFLFLFFILLYKSFSFSFIIFSYSAFLFKSGDILIFFLLSFILFSNLLFFESTDLGLFIFLSFGLLLLLFPNVINLGLLCVTELSLFSSFLFNFSIDEPTFIIPVLPDSVPTLKPFVLFLSLFFLYLLSFSVDFDLFSTILALICIIFFILFW